MTVPAQLRRLVDGELFTLTDQVTSIGRGEGQDITVAISAVSRSHAEIERTAHGYVLRDLGSRNGTFVNGDRVDHHGRPLREDDEIVLAGVEALRFVDPMATPLGPSVGRLRGVWIDPHTAAVWVDAHPIEPPLSDRQQALLELLDERVGSTVSREDVVAAVWADAAAEGVSPAAVDALVKRLKARLRPHQLGDDLIEVVRDRGIRLRRP